MAESPRRRAVARGSAGGRDQGAVVLPVPDGRWMPRRVAMISLHTSPLDQPGTGDAGGMNVYVVELSRRLAALGVHVEIFTRATSGALPSTVEMAPGVRVRNVVAGPLEGLTKADLPAQLCAFARQVLRVEAAHEPGYFDVIHSHYWLSGQIGALARDRWGIPLVHSMHTMAKVKNALLAHGDNPEPQARVIGEEQVVDAADMLVANTAAEQQQLVDLYSATPERVSVVRPGVDLRVFRPGSTAEARSLLGFPRHALVVMFAGRIQPLKAPDVVVRAAAELLRRRPSLRRRLVVPVIGGASGSGVDTPEALRALADRLGVRDVVRFVPPVDQATLVSYYRAASLVCVPSYNESFGLVALEAQACGTPVVAARVGGLATAVRDGETGLTIEGHDPRDYAHAFERLLTDDRRRRTMGRAGVEHAQAFGWTRTAQEVLESYRRAGTLLRQEALALAR